VLFVAAVIDFARPSAAGTMWGNIALVRATAIPEDVASLTSSAFSAKRLVVDRLEGVAGDEILTALAFGWSASGSQRPAKR
jgi:hypothetical protein